MSLLGKDWYAEYIDYKDGYKAGYEAAMKEIRERKMGKMGKWEEKYMTEEEWIRGAPSKVCPFCHNVNHNGRTHYCPHCGAKMEVD